MGRYATLPTLFDEVNILCLKFLKQHGYLNPNKPQQGVVTWTSRNFGTKSSINIQSRLTNCNRLFIELDYTYNKQPRNYSISIAYVPSNLGVGEIEYFVCPQTQKHCRKLHCIDGWFFHRSAFKGCYYDSQIVSKRFRRYTTALNNYRDFSEIYKQQHKKYRKTHYRGKPTKGEIQLLKKLQSAQIGENVIDTLLMM